jgi:hypothetical protein
LIFFDGGGVATGWNNATILTTVQNYVNIDKHYATKAKKCI